MNPRKRDTPQELSSNSRRTHMVAWTEAKGKTQSNNDRKEIKRISLGMGETRVRLVGGVMPRYCYWVVTNEGKRMPVECLQFNREKEAFDSKADDPFTEVDPDIYSEKASFSYVCNVIDRKDNEVKLLDLRSTIYSQIVDYASNPEYGSPADPDSGYDIVIKKEKTGPLPQNVKYTVIPARSNTALSAEERAMELFDLDAIFKRPDYTTQKEWLLQNTNLFAGDVTDEFKSSEEVDDLA